MRILTSISIPLSPQSSVTFHSFRPPPFHSLSLSLRRYGRCSVIGWTKSLWCARAAWPPVSPPPRAAPSRCQRPSEALLAHSKASPQVERAKETWGLRNMFFLFIYFFLGGLSFFYWCTFRFLVEIHLLGWVHWIRKERR
jgi:hypothetical protein